MSQKEFDIIVYGASGYTGQLVAEYLFGQYGTGKLRWAMAGRSQDKLETVRRDNGIAEQVPLIVSDATDADALSALCLLYTSPSPRDGLLSRMPSSA